MKITTWCGFASFALGMLLTAPVASAAPKNVLVVTTTTGFRHSSIPTAEKVLAELAKDSKAFSVDYARVDQESPEFKPENNSDEAKKAAKAKVEAAIAKVLAEKMNPAALKKYDGIIFANTTGDLPLPDKDAFLDWIRSGKAFVGMHSAADTFHHFPGYIEMLGGEFLTHGAQVEVDAINQDKGCPMCSHLPGQWKIYDEIYQFKNFDTTKFHGLLTLDKHPNNKSPGTYPVSWCKEYGKGKVFYTSLGHREDVWDPNTPENFKRMNSKEIAEAYQKHILNGIKWTLGLEKWDIKKGRVE